MAAVQTPVSFPENAPPPAAHDVSPLSPLLAMRRDAAVATSATIGDRRAPATSLFASPAPTVPTDNLTGGLGMAVTPGEQNGGLLRRSARTPGASSKGPAGVVGQLPFMSPSLGALTPIHGPQAATPSLTPAKGGSVGVGGIATPSSLEGDGARGAGLIDSAVLADAALAGYPAAAAAPSGAVAAADVQVATVSMEALTAATAHAAAAEMALTGSVAPAEPVDAEPVLSSASRSVLSVVTSASASSFTSSDGSAASPDDDSVAGRRRKRQLSFPTPTVPSKASDNRDTELGAGAGAGNGVPVPESPAEKTAVAVLSKMASSTTRSRRGRRSTSRRSLPNATPPQGKENQEEDHGISPGQAAAMAEAGIPVAVKRGRKSAEKASASAQKASAAHSATRGRAAKRSRH